MFRNKRIATLMVGAFLSAPAAAQDCLPPDGSSEDRLSSIFGDCCGCDDFWTRPAMTGDWGGLRTAAKESGVTFAGRSTHFGFGVNGGITNPVLPVFGRGDTFQYTGRGEYDVILDTEKFGGLPHGSLLIRGEQWYGEYGNVSLRTGAIPPSVFPAALPPAPDSQGELFMTNFVLTQPLSKNFAFFVGKKDVLGAADQDEFAGGDGTNQFVNQALVANPAFSWACRTPDSPPGLFRPRIGAASAPSSTTPRTGRRTSLISGISSTPE